ncbi:MAG TPA: M14 family metallopeptidase [Gemmatimonadales bacterium]|nr:M14 family metallopeptidase [Gemmatimonadales bacterium]
MSARTVFAWTAAARAAVITAVAFLARPGMIWGQAEDPRQPNWAKYHATADAHALLRGWASAFPNLTELYSIGRTLKGTELMVLEITNEQTGAAATKPAYYYDGNIHAGELTGGEVALHFAWYVLTNYGRDPRVTRLLDTRALYVRPKFNPDGADITLTSPHGLRSTPRPYDEDFDGLLDEDPGNDLNGDGVLTEMRVANPAGLWKVSADDPRLMVRRTEADISGTFYDMISEGVDDDGDGRFNEDGIGGIDMNRNFPREWGLEFEQDGAGPFPLSEPETRATIEFLDSHRNVTGIFHGHTSGGFLYRLPSTGPWDAFNLFDQNLILELAAKYNQTTKQPVIPSYDNPRVHRHGTLISWGYWDFGVIGFVPEFWGGFGRDYDGNGSVSQLERLRWNDEELRGAGFVAWTPFDHPQLGRVEIGGWKTRFTGQNPPPHLLKGEIEKYVPWMLWLAEVSPRVVIRDASATPAGAAGVFKIAVTVENEGYLATNITQRALDARLAPPVRALIELRDAELVSGAKRTEIGHLKGSRDTQGDMRRAESRRTVEYVARVTGARPLATITVVSEKGGTTKREVVLGGR